MNKFFLDPTSVFSTQFYRSQVCVSLHNSFFWY